MRTRTEADSAFLDLVQDSLQASAKEAERIAALTGTRLVRIDSVQPAVPDLLLTILEVLGRSTTNPKGKNARATPSQRKNKSAPRKCYGKQLQIDMYLSKKRRRSRS